MRNQILVPASWRLPVSGSASNTCTISCDGVMVPGYLRVTSTLMLRVIEFLGLTRLRMVELEEIEKASPSLGRLSRAGSERNSG